MGWFDKKQNKNTQQPEYEPTVKAGPPYQETVQAGSVPPWMMPPTNTINAWDNTQPNSPFHSAPTSGLQEYTIPASNKPIEQTVPVVRSGLPTPSPYPPYNQQPPLYLQNGQQQQQLQYDPTQRAVPNLPTMDELRQREREYAAAQQGMPPPAPLQPAVPPPVQETVGLGRRIWRTIAPEFVSLILAVIQILFLVRFILKLLALTGTTASWIDIVYSVSDLFVWPFYLLWKLVPWQIPERIELYTLAGLVILMLITPMIVRWLKARRTKLREKRAQK